jgi:hypothetical protein
MSLIQLAPMLHALPREEKLLALQLLSTDLCAETSVTLIPEATYDVHTPEAPAKTAATLMQLLGADAGEK